MALLRKFSWQRFAPSGLTPSLVSRYRRKARRASARTVKPFVAKKAANGISTARGHSAVPSRGRGNGFGRAWATLSELNAHWSDAVLDARGKSEGWTEEVRKKASDAAAAFGEGLSRVRKGVEIAALLFRRHGHRSHELKADQGEPVPVILGSAPPRSLSLSRVRHRKRSSVLTLARRKLTT